MAKYDEPSDFAVKFIMKKVIIPRMEDRGVTRYKMAQELDVQQSTIKRWLEVDVKVSLHNFIRMLAYLELKPLFLPKEYDDTPDDGRVHFN